MITNQIFGKKICGYWSMGHNTSAAAFKKGLFEGIYKQIFHMVSSVFKFHSSEYVEIINNLVLCFSMHCKYFGAKRLVFFFFEKLLVLIENKNFKIKPIKFVIEILNIFFHSFHKMLWKYQ